MGPQQEGAGKLGIADYIASIRGNPARAMTLRYVQEPGAHVAFHEDDTVLVDAAGNARSTSISGWHYLWDMRYFPGFTYRAITDLTAPSAQTWYVEQAGETAQSVAEALILYYSGSDNYPVDSIGRVSGDSVTFTAMAVVNSENKRQTLETVCQLAPRSGQPLCNITLDGKLNATITYEESVETVQRPDLPRLFPAEFRPVTNTYASRKALTAAARKATPNAATVKATFGGNASVTAPFGSATAAGLIARSSYQAGSKFLAMVTFISTFDADLYAHTLVDSDTLVSVDTRTNIITLTRPGTKLATVFAVHRNMLVLIESPSGKAAALKVLKILR